MSNSVLEAMASGLAIITTNTGGAKELIQGNGYITKKKSVDDLRIAISKLINDKEKIKEMGKRSRHITEKMSWRNIGDKYFKVYCDI